VSVPQYVEKFDDDDNDDDNNNNNNNNDKIRYSKGRS
jgi:hypothetical protein